MNTRKTVRWLIFRFSFAISWFVSQVGITKSKGSTKPLLFLFFLYVLCAFFMLVLSAIRYQHPPPLPDKPLRPLTAPPLIYFSIWQQAGGSWHGGAVQRPLRWTLSWAPWFCQRLERWSRKRRRLYCGWSKMISVAAVFYSTEYRPSQNAPNGFVMTACRHPAPGHL